MDRATGLPWREREGEGPAEGGSGAGTKNRLKVRAIPPITRLGPTAHTGPNGPRRSTMLLYVSLRATVIVMLVGLGGCTAASTDPGNTAEDPESATSINGVSLNGVSLNGVSLNGVSLNGLSVSGLATAQFSLWFNQNATTSETTMEYVVKCAYSATSSLSWTNPF